MQSINFNKEDFLTCYNFARSSDIVHSEIITRQEFESLKLDNTKIMYENDKYLLYKLKNFEIKENDIIFTNHFFLNELFNKLNKINNLKNIKLVTHWSDDVVDKKLFDKKPKCISKWYGIHVAYEHPDLIALPVGIDSGHSTKNLLTNHFLKQNKNSSEKKEILLYINFQENTNNAARKNVKELFINKDWAIIDKPNLPLEKYYERIADSKFVLSPLGNGPDTHRLWEALYTGSVPITKYHETYQALKDLPIVFVDNYEDISEELLESEYKRIKSEKFNFDKLKQSYWRNIITENKINSNESSIIFFNDYELLIMKIKHKLIRNLLKYEKRIMFRVNQLKKKLNITS